MEKTHAVYSTKTKIVRLIIWLFLAFVAIITIFPVCYVIFGSFKDNKELLVGGLTPASIRESKSAFRCSEKPIARILARVNAPLRSVSP